MGKLISSINITPDGFCGHELVIADEEFHRFTKNLLNKSETAIFGRNTFALFQRYWPSVLTSQNHSKSHIELAQIINDIDKVVFSKMLNNPQWNNSSVWKEINKREILELKQKADKDLLILGSPGIVEELSKLGLIDEYYFSIQPILAGNGGKRLFDITNLDKNQKLNLIETKQLKSGVVILNYQTIS